MSAKPYAAQPGTFPASVIGWLTSLGPDAERTSADIAEHFDRKLYDVRSLLAHALERGGLATRVDRRKCYWSIPAAATPASPPPPAGDDDPAGPDDATAGRFIHRIVTWPGTAALPSVPAASPAARFACALWNDGRLVIEQPGAAAVTLTTDETAALVAYLERLAESPAA